MTLLKSNSVTKLMFLNRDILFIVMLSFTFRKPTTLGGMLRSPFSLPCLLCLLTFSRPRLTAAKKVAGVKVDWTKWQDEDEEAEEAASKQEEMSNLLQGVGGRKRGVSGVTET